MIQLVAEFFDLAARTSGILVCIMLNLSVARSLLLPKSHSAEPLLSRSIASFLLVFAFALGVHLVIP